MVPTDTVAHSIGTFGQANANSGKKSQKILFHQSHCTSQDVEVK